MVAAGCTSTPTEETEKFVLKYYLGEPQNLLTTNTNESEGSQVLTALYEPLVDFDEQTRPVMAAADSVESDDNVEWTIKLKPGRTFHNGEPVDADSFIQAWNYGAFGPNGQGNNYFFAFIEGYNEMNPPEGEEPTATELSGLEKVDDLTFTVTLYDPFSEWPLVIGYTPFFPLPDAAFSEPGVIDEDFEQAPIGNGPFKMVGTWQHDQLIQVEKWADFQGTQPKIDGVDFTIYVGETATNAGYNDLLADNVDVMDTVPLNQLANVESDLGDRFQQSPSSTFQYLAFPVTNPKYSNANVRKAISMAIDRDELIEKIFLNSQRSADAFVSPVVAGYRPGACGEACEFDPAAAKTLYEANGGPAEISITYNADGGHKEWVDAACNQLQNNLGVTCTGIGEARFADVLDKLDSGADIGFFRLGWIMDYPSMQNYLGPLYSTNGSSNYYGYSNPEFDALVKQGESAPSQEEAIEFYQQAEDILAEDVPVLPMRFGQNNYAFSTKVTDVYFDQFGRCDLIRIAPAA
jgi:peptide/nickel transport system substrate-binding protein/oligopeptide transport system substrate-binding protein